MRKAVKPLFLPLKGLYFDLFADGRKTWELRQQVGGWNTNQLYTARGLTLSYGYGTKHRIPSLVGDVKTAASIDEMIERHEWLWRAINPLAESKEAMIASAKALFKDERPPIAFEVIQERDCTSPECPRCRKAIWCWDGLDIGSTFECQHCNAPLKTVGSYSHLHDEEWPVFHTNH